MGYIYKNNSFNLKKLNKSGFKIIYNINYLYRNKFFFMYISPVTLKIQKSRNKVIFLEGEISVMEFE